MIVADKYKNCALDMLSNEKFLALQLWELKHVFYNEASAIKNAKLEFVGFSNQFAAEFHLDASALGRSLVDIANIDPRVSLEITEQEQDIINTGQLSDTVFNFTYNKSLTNYFIRKRPLINPATGDVVGIIIFAIKFDPLEQRKVVLNNFLRKILPRQTVNSEKLNEAQQQIVTCLLMGFHQRKEIASILSNITDKEFSETRIKNSLHTLYQKFSCNSPGELINLIAASGDIEFKLSGIKIPDGSHPVKC